MTQRTRRGRGGPAVHEHRIAPDRGAPSSARRMVEEHAPSETSEEALDRLRLLASELVTAAVVAAEGDPGRSALTFRIADVGDAVRLEVEPLRRPAALLHPLVDAVAARVGHEPHRGLAWAEAPVGRPGA
jgi:hypothetical protein